MKTLVIGKGEVGQAIYEVSLKAHQTFIRDIEGIPCPNVEILHIAYPDHKGFAQTTKDYIQEYKPALTIIHSSVRVGTTDQCGEHVIYSPVRGRHPNLTKAIQTYWKIIAGRDKEDLQLAHDYFLACKVKTLFTHDIVGAELVKLLSNIHMGLEIAWRQEVGRILEHFGASAETYESWEDTYNSGYTVDGDVHLIRPRMKADPIGGHCILPCTELLKTQFESKALDFILESNKQKLREKKNELCLTK